MIDVYIHVVNLDCYSMDSRTEGVWLPLPFNREQLADMYRCVTGNVGNTPICIKEIESGKLDVIINPFANIFELNKIAKRIRKLSKQEVMKLAAIVEMNNLKRGGEQDFSNIQEELAVIDKYDFLADVHNDTDLRKYFKSGLSNDSVFYTSRGALVKNS